MDAFLAGLAAVADPQILFLVFAGTVLGVVVGALPGISGSTTTALLLPLTITMTPNAAIAFLGSIYCAANFGGSITAILINTPGDPSASATAFDGYPLAKRGEAGRALGMSAVASAIGGIFSVIVLIVAAPLLARLAYQFGPPEYFALALFGLSMVAAVGGDSPVKNLMAAASGVLLATVGLDLTTGVERFTFGVPALSDGLDFIPVLVGLFAMAELLERARAAWRDPGIHQAAFGEAAEPGRFPQVRQGDQLVQRDRHVHRRAARARRHDRGFDLLQRDQALVEAQGGVRQGRDRGRGGPRSREQRRRGRRDGADPGARHSRQHHDRDHPRRSAWCRACGPGRISSTSSRRCSTSCSARCSPPTCSISSSAWAPRKSSRASR